MWSLVISGLQQGGHEVFAVSGPWSTFADYLRDVRLWRQTGHLDFRLF
jgi:hypothetical protein